MRRRWFVALAVTAVVALGAGGGPGIGDGYFPNYGNGGYNVRHYDLTVKYNPASDWLTGSAKISARAAQDLTAFNLDLVGLTVRSVTIDDAGSGGPVSARWVRDAHELRVVPGRRILDGTDFVVAVRYGGVPATLDTVLGASGFFHTDDGALIEGEPEVAATWFPVNDHPLDKASYTFRVRVPDGYDVVANGVPAGTTSQNGWSTHIWQATDPMASYLATVDIGQWNVNDRTTASGIRVIDAIDPDIASYTASSFAREEEMLAFLADRFGPYPFRVAGGIVDDQPGISFALETQTRPIYSFPFFVVGQGDVVLVHELAHQWFGDSVSLARWRDIWLNEGFATFAEWLWTEHEGGTTARQMFWGLYGLPTETDFWSLPIGNPGPAHLFDIQVYWRGAMTLEALRINVGDAKFFKILRTWAADNRGGHGTTARFVALAEQITGRQLDGLFDAWLNAPVRPPSPVTVTSSQRAAAAEQPAAPAVVGDWLAGLQHRIALGQR